MSKSEKMKALASKLASKKMPDDADGNALKNRSNSFIDMTNQKANLKKYGKAPDTKYDMKKTRRAVTNAKSQGR